MSLGLLHLHS